MDLATALEFIETRLQPDVDPVIEAAELGVLLGLAVTTDADDIDPTGDDWTPTYSVTGCYRVIAEGYAIKHAKAVGRYSFTTDGQTFQRNQLLDHLEHQRNVYARKVQATTGV